MAPQKAHLKRILTDLLGERRRVLSDNPLLVSSAVLIPLFEKNDGICLLFTKRTNHVAHHKGQVCFPGGVRDPGDPTLLHTALRECNEEIGLSAESIQVIGALDDTPTMATNYVITPYVGLIEGRPELTKCSPEVERIISVPLESLLSSKYPADLFQITDGELRHVPGYQYNGDLIWGATARIVDQFVTLVRPFLS